MKKVQFLAMASLALWLTTALPGYAKPEAHIDLKAMTFNIRYGKARDGENHWDKRKEQVFGVIQNHSPDIVGLQEALRFQIDEIKESLPGYAEIGTARQGEKEGEYSAILYRIDRFVVDESGTFWLSDTPEVPSASWGNKYLRICTWGHFTDKQSSLTFYFYNTHWDHRSQPSREKSARLIADTIQKRTHPDPAILTGDFNAGESNPAIEHLGKRKDTRNPDQPLLVNTFRTLHPNEKTVGTFNGFKGKTNGDMIDYIFATPDILPLQSTIIRDEQNGRYPSDHFPIAAKLRIGGVSRKY